MVFLARKQRKKAGTGKILSLPAGIVRTVQKLLSLFGNM